MEASWEASLTLLEFSKAAKGQHDWKMVPLGHRKPPSAVRGDRKWGGEWFEIPQQDDFSFIPPLLNGACVHLPTEAAILPSMVSVLVGMLF